MTKPAEDLRASYARFDDLAVIKEFWEKRDTKFEASRREIFKLFKNKGVEESRVRLALRSGAIKARRVDFSAVKPIAEAQAAVDELMSKLKEQQKSGVNEPIFVQVPLDMSKRYPENGIDCDAPGVIFINVESARQWFEAGCPI